jgi:hypothetical protein
MARHVVWQDSEQVAWTEHDGPGRPPAAASRNLWLALAGVLAVVFSAMMFTDVLCPEHRAWVQTLGSFALLGSATSAIALLRAWSAAPLLTLATAATGVPIGLIDAQHDPTRGRLVALAFAVCVVGSFALWARQMTITRWSRHTLATGAPAPVEGLELPASAATPIQPAPAAVDEREVTVRR